jgi:uncharacterized protein YkwD
MRMVRLLPLLAGLMGATVLLAPLLAASPVIAQDANDAGQGGAREQPPAPVMQEESVLFRLANEERARNGIPPLQFDDALLDTARLRAGEQARAGTLNHTDASGGLAFSRLLSEAGIQIRVAGEALVRVNGPVDSLPAYAHQTLVGSERHRTLLLDPRFTHLAVGAAATPGQLVFAQIFSARWEGS